MYPSVTDAEQDGACEALDAILQGTSPDFSQLLEIGPGVGGVGVLSSRIGRRRSSGRGRRGARGANIRLVGTPHPEGSRDPLRSCTSAAAGLTVTPDRAVRATAARPG